MLYKLAPSILSANFSRLEEEVKKVERKADYLHIDVMDGHFVPNLTIGPPVVKALRKVTDLFFDVHLMVTNPEGLINAFADAGADLICVHAESTFHLHRLIQSIKELGKKVGVALNPASPPELVLPILDEIDLVLLMSVNPGFGGQKFIQSTIAKITRLRAIIAERGLEVELEVDGGIGPQTLPGVIKAGANVFVAGSAIFGQPSPGDAITEMKNIIKREGV